MKKITLIAALSIPTFIAFGQDTDAALSRTIFKLSPQHFVHNSLKAGIERFNANHSSSFAIFLTGMMENENSEFYSDGYDGLAGEFQLRKYISPMKSATSKQGKTYYQGVYGAAYLQGGFYTGDFKGQSSDYDPLTGAWTLTEYNYTEEVTNGGFGFTIGYQKTLWQVIFLEAFIGGGIQFSSQNFKGAVGTAENWGDDGIIDPSYKGILPKIGVHIGIGL